MEKINYVNQEDMNQEEMYEIFGFSADEVISTSDWQCSNEFVTNAPSMEAELRSLLDLSATIAYTEPILDIPTKLKQRLLNRIKQETKILDLVAKQSGKLKWRPHPVKGLVMSILNIDLFKKQVSALVRAEVTVAYPSHRHAKGEELFMIEGELIDRGISYKAGDYLYSDAGSVHAPTAIAGCMFFVKTSLDDAFL